MVCLTTSAEVTFTDIFRNLQNIYDREYLRKYLTAFSLEFLQKNSIIDIWQGPKYAFKWIFSSLSSSQKSLEAATEGAL